MTSTKGPEAGVWVIAETKDLPTKYVKIVVTDDLGRYVLPDLPAANYSIWVRGYGLVDSPKVQSVPGKSLNLTAVLAPSAKEAAEYYPANYWYSLLQPPAESEFPGTGIKQGGNGIPETVKTQGQWIAHIKSAPSCTHCHQMGTKITRTISPELRKQFGTSLAAWGARTRGGVWGPFMQNELTALGRDRALGVFADWTDRIEKGELPPTPPRPQGVERGVVITMWDVGHETTFFHDVISTDRWNPTSNANGPVYGTWEHSGDAFTILDPVKNTQRTVQLPSDAPALTPRPITGPSLHYGRQIIEQWDAAKVAPHNPMMDAKGRLWMTSFERDGCRVYEPKTEKISRLPGCFLYHHLQFDKNNMLWGNGGAGVISYFDAVKWDETGDGVKPGGVVTRHVLDTNGNGKADLSPIPEDQQSTDPTKDVYSRRGLYQVVPSPADGSVWGASLGVPGSIVRYDPKTQLSEVYEPPYLNPKVPFNAYEPHAVDVDSSNGVVWTGMVSGHLASFDRRKCKVLNGSTATGKHCLEGWTLHDVPGPNFKGVNKINGVGTDGFYLTWTDWHNASGFGNNTPILTGSTSDSLIAFADGKFVTMRVPYPLGFHARGMDGRIDDPKAGWKGRGLWSNYATVASWHIEGGKGTHPKVVKIQMRPNPLAK